MVPFVVNPSGFCTVTYSCGMLSGARLDLCNLIDPAVTVSFDSSTGDYQFSCSDMTVVTPGPYVFEITGTVGTNVETIQFTLTLVDPCLDPTFISLVTPLHFIG